MTNQNMNEALRTLAGVTQPTPAATVAAPRVAKGNAGNGAGQTLPAARNMNHWLKSAARGRAQTEFITITGGTK